jgi:mannose-6-phosphate isomerase-like protein (cupin superfamily)
LNRWGIAGSRNAPQLAASRKGDKQERLPVAKQYIVVDFDQVPSVACPCGTAQRALADAPDYPATIHRTTITGTAQTHYHRRLTETYFIIECEPGAALELDGDQVPLKPGMCVLIPPGVHHRAVGRMTILNIVIPKFDPKDEVIVE